MVQWEQYPTYQDGKVSFKGTLLNDGVFSHLGASPRLGAEVYPNFRGRLASDRIYLGSILPQGSTLPLSGYRLYPFDVIADSYQLNGQSFNVSFTFPTDLAGAPSDYVVTVYGFQDETRNPTIGTYRDSGTLTDLLGYARIRMSSPYETATATSTPTPVPVVTLVSSHETQNTRWLVSNYPALATQIQNFAWVQDGISDSERPTLDELLYLGTVEIDALEAVLALPWVQDTISTAEHDIINWLDVFPGGPQQVLALPWIQDAVSETEYDIIDWLTTWQDDFPGGSQKVLAMPWLQDTVSETDHQAVYWLVALGIDQPELTHQLLAMPFLSVSDSADVLALRAMELLDGWGGLSTLTQHPVFKDGITDAETLLVTAAGTFYHNPAGMQRLLDRGVGAVQTNSLGTSLTPDLRISVVQPDGQSWPGIAEAMRGMLEFTESKMGIPLPVHHVTVVLDSEAIPGLADAANFEFALVFSPLDEQQRTTVAWEVWQSNFVHEASHFYWGHDYEPWLKEGLANTMQTRFEREAMGWSVEESQPEPWGCEAHDLQMLAGWDFVEATTDPERFACYYYLGELLMLELLASVGNTAFDEKLRELYADAQERPGETSGIDEIRRVFPGQAEIVEKHWSGGMNAPENRP